MKLSHFLTIAAAVFFLFTSCGIDKTAGTVGDGNPEKPNVSVGKLDFYPNFESESGLVTPRNVYVWLPENYSKSKKYAVLYMSDGQNLFDPEKMFNHQEWRVDEVVGGLLEEGRDWFICRNPLQTDSVDFDAWLFARPLSEIEPDAFL